MKKAEIAIPIDDTAIHGNLTHIELSHSIIIFAHGSGSSRLSPRNQFVADVFHKAQLSTFLFDLLTPEEEKIDNYTREYRFDIELLAKRLIIATEWLQQHHVTAFLKRGYFGASTGAAAALIASTRLTNDIYAIVSRGGRPDLALNYLKKVTSPTLFIVGALDSEVIELNTMAFNMLTCEKEMKLIPGATHLFEEDDTLLQAAQLAAQWFKEHE